VRPFVHHHTVTPFEPARRFRPPLARLNFWQRRRELERLEQLGRETAAQIDAGGYDVVYANPSRWTQAPTLIEYLRTPAVYRVHDFRAVHEGPIRRRYPGGWTGWWSPALDALDPVRRSFERKLRDIDERNTRRASVALTDSEFAAANIAAIYGRVAVPVWCGVDTTRFRPLGDPGERPGAVISVGAMRAEKGFDFVIRALASMPMPSRPPLHIAANADFPPERKRLISLAREVGVELRLELDVPPDELVHRLNGAAVFVYATRREPLGISALEAMACALPVVAVGEGGVLETVVDGVTGRLVPRDERAFGAAVSTLLADDELRRRLGEQARDHVIERWSWESSVRLVEQGLEAAAGGGR